MYEKIAPLLLSWGYYRLKPAIPWSVRIAVRRWLARRILPRVADRWPISKIAGAPPKDFPGWPEEKRFAFVITHDVEGEAGIERCGQVMELDAAHEFLSSFNFVPEGSYRLLPALREALRREGFEIGVHDLRHDGKLYNSRVEFRKDAARINRHLQEWDAVGFRSAFMHRNLDWLHDLNITYDASTFDTDPFEPYPDGVNTIFPFWQAADDGRSGYIELPYTLPQDSTLFLVLKDDGIDVWKQKLDWIAERGGMALINVHPDYMCFEGKPRRNEYPSAYYAEFLRYVRTAYDGQYWNALPREVAQHARAVLAAA